MILDKITTVYNPVTKIIVGEFQIGVDLYPAVGCDTFEGTVQEFKMLNTEYEELNIQE